MHMFMWFGYDLGEFLFAGLEVKSRLSFALTWLTLFVTALLFEASKVYLARVQRDAVKTLYPYRNDERRNLLCERDQTHVEPSTSRNLGGAPASGWEVVRVRTMVNLHQAFVFVVHNLAGYLLMLCVMLYNVHLLLACVFGMMLGYFLFGPKLTELQMQCFGTKKTVICTPECDHTAATSTPPLIDSSGSETDLFICRTRTCIQPSHYFPASTDETPTCSYGAKRCPSMVARARATCHKEIEKEDSPSIEDVKLLITQRQGCCKKPLSEQCCKEVKKSKDIEQNRDNNAESEESPDNDKAGSKELPEVSSKSEACNQEVTSEEHKLEKCCKKEPGTEIGYIKHETTAPERERHTDIKCCGSKTDSLEEIVK